MDFLTELDIHDRHINYAVAAAMDMASMSFDERDGWCDDAKQVAIEAILEHTDKQRNWLLSRAKWAVFDWIVSFVYDSPPEYVKEDFVFPESELESNEYWIDLAIYVYDVFVSLGLRSAEEYAKIFVLRARGNTYQNISVMLDMNYDVVRVMSSRARKYFNRYTNSPKVLYTN